MVKAVLSLSFSIENRDGVYLSSSFSGLGTFDHLDTTYYSSRLLEGYKLLSSWASGIGYRYPLSDRWALLGGLSYQQSRYIYREIYTDVQQQLIMSDTAVVYTNNIAGNIIEAGEVTKTTTTQFSAQQYSYHHMISGQLGIQYQLHRNIYTGARLDFGLVQWSAGNIISPDNSFIPVEIKESRSPRLMIETGGQFELISGLDLQFGATFRPARGSRKINTTLDQNLSALGLNARLIYRW